jgi:hypothetical protein
MLARMLCYYLGRLFLQRMSTGEIGFLSLLQIYILELQQQDKSISRIKIKALQPDLGVGNSELPKGGAEGVPRF